MILRTLDDTDALAQQLIEDLPPGSLLLLDGPLGAGKTTLVQRMARAAGSTAVVTSPTYTLIHEVPTPKGLLTHVDAYRLQRPEALFELGLEDYLDRSWLVVVEWGSSLREHLPGASLLRIELRSDGTRVASWIPPRVEAPSSSR